MESDREPPPGPVKPIPLEYGTDPLLPPPVMSDRRFLFQFVSGCLIGLGMSCLEWSSTSSLASARVGWVVLIAKAAAGVGLAWKPRFRGIGCGVILWVLVSALIYTIGVVCGWKS